MPPASLLHVEGSPSDGHDGKPKSAAQTARKANGEDPGQSR